MVSIVASLLLAIFATSQAQPNSSVAQIPITATAEVPSLLANLAGSAPVLNMSSGLDSDVLGDVQQNTPNMSRPSLRGTKDSLNLTLQSSRCTHTIIDSVRTLEWCVGQCKLWNFEKACFTGYKWWAQMGKCLCGKADCQKMGLEGGGIFKICFP